MQPRQRRREVVDQRRELDVAEGVEVDRLRAQDTGSDVRPGPLQVEQSTRVHSATQVLDVDARGEVRTGWGEQVATVERAAHVRQRVVRLLEQVRRGDAAETRGRGHEQSVVRPHEVVTASCLQGHTLTRRADARVDHGHVGPDGQVGRGAPEQQRSVADGELVDVMRDIHDMGLGTDAGHDRSHDAGRRVARPEVAEQAHERRSRAAGRGGVGRGRDGIGVDPHRGDGTRAVTVCVRPNRTGGVTAVCCRPDDQTSA